MKTWGLFTWGFGVFVLVLSVAGCQMPVRPSSAGAEVPLSTPARIAVDAPMAWGGQVRCAAGDCFLAVVEHEKNMLALHQLKGRSARLLDRYAVAYHPDSAVWLTDDLLAAAVEGSSGLDIFRVDAERMVRLHQAEVGFAPRDVMLVSSAPGQYKLLVTPYSGKEVAWVDWRQATPETAQVQKVHWCEAPWHPVHVGRLPGMEGGGIAVACLDDRKVIAVPNADLLSPPRVLARFDVVARQARPSPSNQWLYVALETGGRNARINMESGELQWLQAPPTGAVSVAPLSDDLVIWGDDRQLYLQQLDVNGIVLETRWLRVSGFATGLQLIDVDSDGKRDLVVLNSSPDVVDVVYGPLWAQSAKTPVIQTKN